MVFRHVERRWDQSTLAADIHHTPQPGFWEPDPSLDFPLFSETGRTGAIASGAGPGSRQILSRRRARTRRENRNALVGIVGHVEPPIQIDETLAAMFYGLGAHRQRP